MNINQKRQDFKKDIDKLISGDYVLMPKVATPVMERAGMENGGGILTQKIYQAMVNASQEKFTDEITFAFSVPVILND